MTLSRRSRLLSTRWRARLRGDQAGPVASPAITALSFQSVERVLALFVTGLTEGALVVTDSAATTVQTVYCDGRTIVLPDQLAHFPTRDDNLILYRALIAHAAAQVLYGTLAQDGALAGLRNSPDDNLLAAIFDIVEGARLSARLAREFPGLGRDLASLGEAGLVMRPTLASLRGAGQAIEALQLRTIIAEETIVTGLRSRDAGQLRELFALLPPDWSALDREETIALARLLQSRIMARGAETTPLPLLGRSRIRLDRLRQELPVNRADRVAIPREPDRPKMTTEASPPAPPLIVEGKNPPPLTQEERHGDPGGGRQLVVSYADTAPQFTARQAPLTDEEKRGGFVYPEWDTTTGSYRPEWCVLRPRRLRATGTEWVERVLRRRHAQVQELKRQFETLRPERQRLRRQEDGEDFDLAVVVESHVDRRLGLPPHERPYSRIREDRRDIAVAFLIDLSGSTGGYVAAPQGGERVIDIAKESLVLLGEALTMLDDRHAIYGFSGSTRKGCEFYTVMDFGDSWDDEPKRRLAGLIPLSYTRLGPPIRHTTTLLQAIPARVRLLILLSDGRPNDFDAYGGEYGIADTRKALLEARGRGIRTFCLTIDNEAREYMPRLFGPNNFAVLANVAALPRRLPDLYRRLTS